MKYAMIENGIVFNIIEAEQDFADSIGAIWIGNMPVNIGDAFDGQKFTRIVDGETIVVYDINPMTPAQQRELAYETMKFRESDGSPMVAWEGGMTVDEGNKLYLAYLAEGDTEKSEALSILIKDAKEYIRSLYPDKEE